MKEKNLGELTNIGFQTYKDRHGRTLVVNRKEKAAYVVTKDEERRLFLFSNRYIIGTVVAILIGSWINYTVGVIRGVVIAVGLELVYRLIYLKSLPKIELDELPRKYSMVSNAMKQPQEKNMIIGGLGILIPILLVINGFQTVKDRNAVWSFENKNDLMLVGASVVIGAAALMGAIVCLIALSRQRKGSE